MLVKSKKKLNYFQPNFYHFSQDSIRLAEIVSQEMSFLPEGSNCLDVGAGCGVIGLEILHRLNRKLNFDFIEIQEEFASYFSLNLNLFKPFPWKCNFYNLDFRAFNSIQRYSLIVSNPPYFSLDRGRVSLNPNRNQCRFFVNGSYGELLLFFKKYLLPTGVGFILIREDWPKDFHFLEYENFFQISKYKINKNTGLIKISPLN